MPARNFNNLNLARVVANNRMRPVFMDVTRPTVRERVRDTPGVRVREPDRPVTPVMARAQVSVAPVLATNLRSRSHLTALSNPVLAAKLAELRPLVTLDVVSEEAGYLRDAATLPVSENSTPSDVTLFEAPRDRNSKFYLPRYRIHEHGGRYDIAVAASQEGGWRLRIGLERFPAPELGRRANGAAELDHQIAVFIRFRAGPSGGIEKRFDFTEVEEHDNERVVVSVGLSLSERDILLHAVQSPESNVQLVIRRAADVAVRIPKASTAKPAKVLIASKAQARVAANATLASRIAERPMALEFAHRINPGGRAGGINTGRRVRPQQAKPRYETRAIV